MASFRYQVTSVGWWRGKIKRWNTTFHMSNSAGTNTIYNAMNKAGWKNSGDVVGACSGGIASIAVYASTGGAPVLRTVYFDWEAPSEWVPYSGTAWADVDPLTPLDAAGESAVVIIGKMGALSSSGKPVTTRKYLHAVPSRTSSDVSVPDVSPATQAALEGLFPSTIMGNAAGVLPTAIEVGPWYLSHQRVRGRRRTVASVAAQSFSLGVLAGGGATTSGQGEPFPGGEF